MNFGPWKDTQSNEFEPPCHTDAVWISLFQMPMLLRLFCRSISSSVRSRGGPRAPLRSWVHSEGFVVLEWSLRLARSESCATEN